ncbi:MAG TPA: NGG1p interacting factor NIF3, partial [Candidatus Omnitrophota bacterium]|nr:NGG1p interacting factor NIF3 [Candidatus Omnitrophota bacterium]
ILSGDTGDDIKTILAGIDVDSSELLLADRLNSKGNNKIDLVLTHHPQGLASANFYEVIEMQAEIFSQLGIPINVCEKLVDARKNEIKRRVHASNHNRTSDTAKLLGLNFMCAHTPADNHVVAYLDKIFKEKHPSTLKDIIKILSGIDEYEIAKKEGAGPMILLGSPNSRCGKIFVDMTGGTEGPKEIIDSLSSCGVGTIVGMHMSEDFYKKIKEKNINVVIAGHISSDNLGLNLLLDKLEKVSKFNILSFSGFRRIKH